MGVSRVLNLSLDQDFFEPAKTDTKTLFAFVSTLEICVKQS